MEREASSLSWESYDPTNTGVGQTTQGSSAADGIRVVVRVRPNAEASRNDALAVTCLSDAKSLEIETAPGSGRKSFSFDSLFDPQTTQQEFFEQCGVRKLVDCALEGFSCTAFAFGQTGSGKTHTITGPDGPSSESGDGIIQRSITYLHNKSREQDVKISATYIEIYNEQVLDLLDTNPRRRVLPVRQQAGGGFHVDNLFIIDCYTEDDMRAVLEEGLRNRQTASHEMNERSSRSHTILTLYIEGHTKLEESDGNGTPGLSFTRKGQISFVDLAGSERAKVTKAEGQTLAESKTINKSLLTLGNCISALSDAKRRGGHIPFRESTLTMLLKDSLGGASMTLMIACVAPSFASAQESSSTLRFASRAKKIQNKPVVQIDPAHEHVIALKRELDALRDECAFLRRASRASDREVMSDPAAMGELAFELVELKKMLQEAMSQSAELRHENVLLVARKEELIRSSEEVMRDNAQLLRIIKELESKGRTKGKKGASGGGRGLHGRGPGTAAAAAAAAAEESVWDRYPRSKASIAGRIDVGGPDVAVVYAAPIALSPISKGTLLSFDKGNETLAREMASGELAQALQGVDDLGGGGARRSGKATKATKAAGAGARAGRVNASPGRTGIAARKPLAHGRAKDPKSPQTGRKQAKAGGGGGGVKALRGGTTLKPAPLSSKRGGARSAKSIDGSPRAARTGRSINDRSGGLTATSPREMSSVSPPRGRHNEGRANTYPSIDSGSSKAKGGQLGGRSATTLSNQALRQDVSALDMEIAQMEQALKAKSPAKSKKKGKSR